jgi:uncharacterized protein YaiI (UPF0178 family)
MQKSYKLIDTDGAVYTFTNINDMYELKDGNGDILLSGIDTGNEFVFNQEDISSEMDYYTLDALRMFLNMIEKCDSNMFEPYEIYEKVK